MQINLGMPSGNYRLVEKDLALRQATDPEFAFFTGNKLLLPGI